VNMVLFGVTAPFAAALMDRFGIRRVVASALTIIATGAALTTVMTQAWQLIFYWGVLIGLGSGSLTMTFAATVTNHWFTERRGLVTGVLTGASHFGQLAFLPLLAWIIDRYHWRPAIVTLTLAALAVAPLAWLLLRDHPADAGLKPYGAKDFVAKPAPVPGTASRAVRVLFGSAKTGPFWLLAGMFIICGASTNGIMWSNFTPAAHDHGMAPTVAASLLSVIGVFSLLGTLASGWLTDRYDPRRLLSVYFSVRAITLIFLPMLLAASVHPSMIAFVVCYGLVDVATVPPTIQLSREFYGKDGPIVFGWVNAAHQVGAGVSAFLGGVTRDAFGSYNIVWYVLAGFCATAALLALVIRRPGPAKGEADETVTEDKGEHPEFSKK
jgi:MFS family permease